MRRAAFAVVLYIEGYVKTTTLHTFKVRKNFRFCVVWVARLRQHMSDCLSLVTYQQTAHAVAPGSNGITLP
jgi:hypothetical protein